MWLQVRTLSVLAFLSIFLLAMPARAQFRGGVQGTVTDETGAVIPGANVALTDQETQRRLETKTDSSGTFIFNGLPPAQYSLVVTQKGFQENDEQVAVNAEAIQQVNVRLQTGAVTSSVTVVAETSPAIDTSNGDVTRSLTTQEILRLPQIGRDPYELLRLTPGIFGDAARTGSGQAVAFPNSGGTSGGSGPGGSNFSLFQVENQVPISADGQRLTSNDYMIDGVSVNSLQWGGAAVVTPNQESVKEIRVNANAYSAEYGYSSGAQIETVSKNGTNEFHGSAVFLMQDPNFNAYNKPSLPSIPDTRVENNFRNYAASIGGPIKKNRLFFFFSNEDVHEHAASFTQQYIETPQFDQAVLSLRPNSIAAKIIGTTGNTPRIAGILPITSCPAGQLPYCQVVNGELDLGSIGGAPGTYFAPNSAGGGLDGIPDIEYANIALPTFNTGQQYNGRVDFTRGNDYIAGSTYVTYSNQNGATANGRPNQDQLVKPVNADVTAIWTHTLSPTMINEARGNFTRFAYNQLQNPGVTNYEIPQVNVQFPSIAQVQYGANQGDTSPGAFAQNTYEFRDAVVKVLGNHNIRFGFEARREQDNDNLAGGARPVYAVQNLWNFANDAPVYEAISANPANGGPPVTQHYFRTHIYAAYVQDDWKVTPKLTLNLGLRWEYFSPMTEKNGNLYDWMPGPGYGNLTQSTIQQVNRLYQPDYKDFAPRFGFAYNPKTSIVLRGGFGIMYDRVEDALFALTRQDNPNSESFGFCCGSASSPFALNAAGQPQIVYGLGSSNSIYSYPFNPATATGIDPVTNTPNGEAVQVYAAPRHFATPYAYIYSFETDILFSKSYVLTVGYQGSADHHLPHIEDLKFLYPVSGLGATNFSDIFSIQPEINSNYNALNATMSHKLSHDFQFQENFRWAKSLDTNSASGPGGGTNPTYPTDRNTEYGPSDFDVKYTTTFSALYELPFYRSQKGFLGKVLGGWRLNDIFTFHTGFPWTAKSGQALQTPSGAGLSPTRPYAYLGGALTGESNSAFLGPNGNFPGGGSQYFLFTYPSGLTTLPPGIGRNVFRGPWYKDDDISLDKEIKFPNRFLGEATALDLRLNVFNVFNQQNFQPFNFFDASTFVDNPLFGQPIQELSGRAVELQARFSF